MKKIIILSIYLFSIIGYSQVSWQGGTAPEANQSGTILFDKTGTPLASYTGTLYALETNLGGNTWHFSSNFTAKMGEDNKLRREQCLKQFNAFDRAAEALIRKAHELAK